ncbi:MAG: hypothetical protein PHC75_08735 [Burkholderiales bacterium]|nr:hypothetical protein [Burkholderiales bacterium]
MQIKINYIIYAVIISTITAYFSLGHLHPDEYYQILEFAAYKLQLRSTNNLTWEFYEQIRPSIQAWFVVYLYKALAFIKCTNPFTITFITRLLSGLLSLYAICLFINTFKSYLHTENKQKWFILLSLFSWLAIFNGIRFSSENISGKIFLIAFCLAINPNFRKNMFSYLLIGILLGFSFIVRFQVGFMIFGFLLWLLIIQKTPIKYLTITVIGLLISAIIGLYLDYLFYGNFVITPWRYFAANLIQGKAAEFSSDPWFFYLTIAAFIPYGPLFIIASLYFIYVRPKNPISWIMVPFIFVHLIISHKEPRFMTPLMSFMPFVILDSLQALKEKYNFVISNKLAKLNTVAWRVNLFAVIIVMFFPSAMQIRINKLMYDYKKPTVFYHITQNGNMLTFYTQPNLRTSKIASPSEAVCAPNENCVLALTCQETLKYGEPNGKLIFSDCPSWLFKLNFNDWISRTPLYRIYELQSVESK